MTMIKYGVSVSYGPSGPWRLFQENDHKIFSLKARGTWPKSPLAALKESIRAWEFRAEWLKDHPGQVMDDPSRHCCGLCHLYNKCFHALSLCERCCTGCPVKEKTNLPYCHQTPTDMFSCLQGNPQQLRAARAEVRFLKSLLPKKKDRKTR